MGTLVTALPRTKSKRSVERVVSYFPARPGVGTLSITLGTAAQAYHVTAFRADPRYGRGRAFRLLKASHDFDTPDAETYCCFVAADPAASTCECLGFLRHAHCKHLAAMEFLVATGKIDETDPGLPAETRTECSHCGGTGVVADEDAAIPAGVPCPECRRGVAGARAPAPAFPKLVTLPTAGRPPAITITCPVCGETARGLPTPTGPAQYKLSCGKCEAWGEASIHVEPDAPPAPRHRPKFRAEGGW